MQERVVLLNNGASSLGQVSGRNVLFFLGSLLKLVASLIQMLLILVYLSPL